MTTNQNGQSGVPVNRFTEGAAAVAEIGGLLDRYLISLDHDKLDEEWARSLFTRDSCVEFPISRHEGIDGLAAYHRAALAAFERTQHLNSPAVVVLHGADRASLRANLISTHVHLPAADPSDEAARVPFATGTSVDGEVRRTPDGWRLTRLSFRLIWATGRPPVSAG
ncbi:nuclear transport factor 2 family protein [Streptomyces sp. NPDC015661]|uniref:nuclear transport factor 2 family protein n=1 Tax=Streptomyces sp. NPDC015661 TaxID=3364961 RepID=UPI0036FE7B34